jgi:hypothetical protein
MVTVEPGGAPVVKPKARAAACSSALRSVVSKSSGLPAAVKETTTLRSPGGGGESAVGGGESAVGGGESAVGGGESAVGGGESVVVGEGGGGDGDGGGGEGGGGTPDDAVALVL